eukprot:Gb_31336 [translate_table: standard]
MDPDRMEHAIEPGNVIFAQKRKVRRAIEAAGIPYTYISANCFAGYFLAGLAQYAYFLPPLDKAFIYGRGNAKEFYSLPQLPGGGLVMFTYVNAVIWVDEDDIAAYTMKAIDDSRTLNKTVYIRPPQNILSQSEVVQIWEKLCGRLLEKPCILEEDWLTQMQVESMSLERKVVMAHLYHIFYRGDLTNFEIDRLEECEASLLYPELEYTTVEFYLHRFI